MYAQRHQRDTAVMMMLGYNLGNDEGGRQTERVAITGAADWRAGDVSRK